MIVGCFVSCVYVYVVKKKKRVRRQRGRGRGYHKTTPMITRPSFSDIDFRTAQKRVQRLPPGLLGFTVCVSVGSLVRLPFSLLQEPET